MPAESFFITPHGPFSLARAATFGFGQREDDGFDGVMRLAFCLDGYASHVGVEVRQDAAHPDSTHPDSTHPDAAHPDAAHADGSHHDGAHPDAAHPDAAHRDAAHRDAAHPGSAAHDGVVRCTVHASGDVDLDRVRRQVARVLSLDHDGAQFLRVGERDPVIGRLQAAAPGLRPPLFYSPYEAAAWSILSSRRPARQMMEVRNRLNGAFGATFDLAGRELSAFPEPAALLDVESFPGIPDDKLRRLHGVARAALAGRLDVDYLQKLGPDQAMVDLQAISGIGPFYSALIVIRATGFADVLPDREPQVLALAARLYHLDATPHPDQFRQLAEPWRPFRTWSAVLIRAVAPLLLTQPHPPAT
jgi:DNA-3-methyladenine glycosylase II